MNMKQRQIGANGSTAIGIENEKVLGQMIRNEKKRGRNCSIECHGYIFDLENYLIMKTNANW